MRCLLLLCLVAVAAATYTNKNRFERLLKRYQHQGRYGPTDETEMMLGSDETDDYMDEYLGRQKYHDQDQYDQDDEQEECNNRYGSRQQCRRGRRNFQENDDEDNLSMDDEETRYKYNQNQGRRSSGLDFEDEEQVGQYDDEEEQQFGGRYTTEQRNKPGKQLRRKFGRQVTSEIDDANTKLASRLYKQCKDERDDKNTVVSPISVQLGLVALERGARGNTRRQIGRVVGGRLHPNERLTVFKTVTRCLKGLTQQNRYDSESTSQGTTTKINTVTGIFVTRPTRAQQQFVRAVKTTLGATVQNCDFQRQPTKCREMINQFVAQKTNHVIKRVLPQDAITDNTKMILVNTLHLKAKWGKAMQQCHTKPGKFIPLDANKIKHVEMLQAKGPFKYYEDELVKIVGIPTAQKQMTMYVIVPKEKDGLTEVEKMHLEDGDELKKLLDHIDERRTQHVQIQLPKFQIKHKIDVRRTLLKQGVTDAFDTLRADFCGITGACKQSEQQGQDYSDESENENEEQERGVWGGRKNRRNMYDDDENQQQTTYFGGEEDFGGQQQTLEKNKRKLHLNKFIHQCTIKVTQQGITATTGSEGQMYENEDDEQMQWGRGRTSSFGGRGREDFEEMIGGGSQNQKNVVKATHAFAFVLKHNPTNQLVLVGRVIDAAQKQPRNLAQTINNVDQL